LVEQSIDSLERVLPKLENPPKDRRELQKVLENLLTGVKEVCEEIRRTNMLMNKRSYKKLLSRSGKKSIEDIVNEIIDRSPVDIVVDIIPPRAEVVVYNDGFIFYTYDEAVEWLNEIKEEYFDEGSTNE